MDLRVLELFSGIGGMHFALSTSGVAAKVVAAMDINPNANAVYAHNFPETSVCNNNIQSLTPAKIEKMNVNMILMSPPCQPHTRVGKRKDIADNRSDALQHICQLLPQCNKTIEYILMENVKGFETSKAHEEFLEALQVSGYIWREFILSPTQFGVPNVRHRYYCLARKREFEFSGGQIYEELPVELDKDCDFEIQLLRNIVEPEEMVDPAYYLDDVTLSKRAFCLDIANVYSKKTMCFTKAYTTYSEGTGSVYSTFTQSEIDFTFKTLGYYDDDEKGKEMRLYSLRQLRLRYFTPREVARLMSFPDYFEFPATTNTKQKYKLLGNSINVLVISFLIKILCS